MIVVPFGPIKRAELAVNVADIGVIDVAIDDVGDNLAAPFPVMFFFRQVASRVSQRTKLGERPAVKLERFRRRDALVVENFFLQGFAVDRHHRSAI